MSHDEKIRMHIATCQICTLASYMKTCPTCKYNVGLSGARKVSMETQFNDWKCGCGIINFSWRETCRICGAAKPQSNVGADYFKTPQSLKDSDEVMRITNELARQGVHIDTEKRENRWFAYIHDDIIVRWEGASQLEAVKGLQDIVDGAKKLQKIMEGTK